MSRETGQNGYASREQGLIGKARSLLERNRASGFTKPSLGQYPHQWNWDAAFIALGLDHLNSTLAREEIRSLLHGQWREGMIPHILYHEGPSDYFPTPDFWGTAEASGSPRLATSGLTQPPLLATALRAIYSRAAAGADEAREFAREVYPAVLNWHRWLHDVRDPQKSGLVSIIHPWESGTDNSTRFTRPLQNLGRVEAPPYSRRDQTHVVAGERPVQEDYERFMYLIGLYRDLAWEGTAVYERAPFLVQDVLFNSVLYRGDADLRWLAEELGEPTGELDAWLASSKAGFDERLWNEEAGLYYDYDLREGRQIEESSCAALMPLHAGVASTEQAGRLVHEHLLDPRHFAPDHETRYFLPSASKSSPYFEPRRYWRGPIWLNVNWLLVQGLERYGYRDEARALRRDSLELAERSGFMEYYDPRDGSACGASGFSWSAALTVDMLLSK